MSEYTIEEKYEFLCQQLALTVPNVLNAKDGTMDFNHGCIWFTFDEMPKTADEMVEQAMAHWMRHPRLNIKGLR